MKKFKLLDGNAVPTTTGGHSVNWDLCVLCQCIKSEALQCPNNSKRNDTGAGYKSLEESLLQFNDIGALPNSINLSELDEGSGIESTLSAHNAKWHKSCRNLYNKTKLDRAVKKNAALESGSDISNAEHHEAFSTDAEECNVGHFTRSFSSSNIGNKFTTCCFLCDGSTGKLHQVTTFEVDRRVRNCAHTLQDLQLIAKISAGDLIALEGRYHVQCLLSLYRRADAVLRDEKDEFLDDSSAGKHSLAFAQLVEYVAEEQLDALSAPVFKLSDLAKKYQLRLQQMGVNVDARVNTTKLKNKLLAQFQT